MDLPPRRPRIPLKQIALVVVAALAGVLLFLLASASANTEFFEASYPYLLAVNGVVVVALAGLVAMQLRELWREYRARFSGVRTRGSWTS